MVACCLRFDEFLNWLLVVGQRDVTTTDMNDIIWLMASMGLSPRLNIRTVRPESSWGNLVKLMVEIKSFGMSSDDFDKDTVSFDELQLMQADLSCVQALIELHLHEIRVVP
nr:hypothetical protein [Tanacetum cinerariifolium]